MAQAQPNTGLHSLLVLPVLTCVFAAFRIIAPAASVANASVADEWCIEQVSGLHLLLNLETGNEDSTWISYSQCCKKFTHVLTSIADAVFALPVAHKRGESTGKHERLHMKPRRTTV